MITPRSYDRRSFLKLTGGVAALAAAVLLAAPAGASARERELPGQAPLAPGASVSEVKDKVFAGRAPQLRAARAGTRAARVYAAPDGQRVEVGVSRSYASDPAADQALVDFLASKKFI